MPAAMLALWGEIARRRHAALFPAKQMRGVLIFSREPQECRAVFHAEQTDRHGLH
jgi:hypothetical protein